MAMALAMLYPEEKEKGGRGHKGFRRCHRNAAANGHKLVSAVLIFLRWGEAARVS